MSYQLNEHDVCRLIDACECYQERTGSEYMYDVYEQLKHKLNNYSDETFPSHLECEIDQPNELNHGTRHHTRDSHRSLAEQS